MLTLFINDCGGKAANNPLAYLIQFEGSIKPDEMKKLELDSFRKVIKFDRDANAKNVLDEILSKVRIQHNIPVEVIVDGTLADFPDHQYDVYKLMSI